MTPKEKAKELVDKFRGFIIDSASKKCALICAEEIEINDPIGCFPSQSQANEEAKYWQEVKQEIEKL